MRKSLVAWFLLIICALVMYFFSNESVTLAVLIALIAAAPASFAMLRLTADKLEISIKEGNVSADKRIFVLRLENKGVLPIASAEVEAICTNLRTGETDSYLIKKSLRPRGSKEVTLIVVPGHAGRYELTVGSAVIRDPLGMWQRPVSFDERRGATFMPELFDMRFVPAGVTAMPESDIEASKVRGAVSGDVIDIKEYVPGDPVRNIHWKLSEKIGKNLVKVLGNPVSDQYLILLDNPADIARDPEALDAVASVYSSLIHTLRKNDMTCYAGWTDPETGKAVIRRIADDSEEAAAADGYLSVPAVMPSAFSDISRDIADDRYVHVVIVGSRIPGNMDIITNGCRATVLKYGETGSFTEGNLTVVGFEASSYKDNTAGMEI